MTKLESVVRQVSDLREFYVKVAAAKRRAAGARARAGTAPKPPGRPKRGHKRGQIYLRARAG